MKEPKGTEIQKSHVFAGFQTEVNPIETTAEVGHIEASPSISRMAKKKETEEKKLLAFSEANNLSQSFN